MNLEQIREYCLSKKGVTESFPFDEKTLVFKVMNKIFLLMNLDGATTLNIKCDPELAIELREKYHAVIPGYHMNKVHWNTIILNSDASDILLFEWIDHSYNLVVSKLTKKVKTKLDTM